jgi:RNA polymerase sigma factor (sigma-70 family)
MKEKTDQELWQGIRSGDQDCFTHIFDRYHATLYNYGCKLSSNSAVVEDAVQDVFIDVWRMRSNLTENITSIKFYLYRSLRRRIHVSSTRNPFTQEITSLADRDVPVNEHNYESSRIDAEYNSLIQSRIQELLAQLPERQLEAITLRYFDSFSIPEISEIMGVNEKSVRNFIYKALTNLRQYKNFILPTVAVLLLLVFF